MLEINNLRFSYQTDDGPRTVLDGLSLTVEAGQITSLLGPSGCGKSTLLRCVAGLEASYEGSIKLGAPLDGLPPHKRHIGLMMQEAHLFGHLNVWRNVAFSFPYQEIAKAKWRDHAIEFLDMVGLADRADDHVDELSGGQRQRVSLARTLAAKPKAILLDEPLASLDTDLRGSLGRQLAQLIAAQAIPAIWVTHDEQEARFGSQVMRMADGRLAPARMDN